MKRIAAVIQDSSESTMLKCKKAQKTYKCVEDLKNKHKLNVDIFEFKGSENEILKKISSELKDYDYIHILKSGDVVFPDFYSSTSITLEYSKRDYCFSHYYSFDRCELVSKPINPCQFIIKRWVLEELSVCSNFNQLYSRVTEQYKGCEVPIVLVLS